MSFAVNARMHVAGPTLADLRAIRRQMSAGLGGVDVPIHARVKDSGLQQLTKLRKELKLVKVEGKTAGEGIEEFGRRIGIAGKRYLAFSLATVGIVKALGALRSGFSDAIDFEKQIIKIGQVSDRTIRQVDGLRKEILNISSSLGVSSSEIAAAAVTLAQTGRPLASVKKDLEAIAKANLSPTFGNAKDTVEGLIAIQNQFKNSGLTTIQILSKLNTVASKFPVEAADLVTAAKKTGGAFEAAGGKLEELLALFSAVRSTTRESADTIGTAFRTITGRLGRIKTINFFKDILDVDLVKDGKILAPFQAIEKIVEGIRKKGIDSKSPVFSSIVEELGGIRQRAKVIPLLLEFDKAQQILNASLRDGDSISRDAAQAQKGLGTQITQVRQEFQKFVDNVLKDPVFRHFATQLLDITKGLIGVADAARPLIPLVGSLGIIFAAKGLIPLKRGISPTLPKIKEFATGGAPGKRVFKGSGKVPGTGLKDDVPALIKPDEFVLRSQAHHKYGTKTLQAINEGRLPANFADDLPKFAKGGSPSDERFPGQRELQKRNEALRKKEDLLDLEEKKNFKKFQETPFYRPFKKRAAKKLAEKNRTELSKVYDEQAKVSEEVTAAIIKKREKRVTSSAKRPGGPLQERAVVSSTPAKRPGGPLQERAVVCLRSWTLKRKIRR
jgi:TP901 family phage tail tape measure protein